MVDRLFIISDIEFKNILDANPVYAPFYNKTIAAAIKDLKEINIIDGFLVGGASQDSKKFIDIIKKTIN